MKRLNYIDALRGLTMVSVVMVHVLVRAFGLNPTVSGLAVVRATFTLPLFFFVSGFFAWRPIEDFDHKRIRKSVWTRIKAMLFGTIIFDTLYLITIHKDPWGWTAGDFDSYWYTFSLFQIFIFYILTILIGKAFKSQLASWALLVILAVDGAIASHFIDPTTWEYNWLITQKTCQYAQFFVVGCFVRCYQEQFFNLLRREYTLTLLAVVYVGCVIAHYYYGKEIRAFSPQLATAIIDYAARYAGLLLVLYIFYVRREWFDGDTPLLRIWRLIGRRTLDIYFLHYFFIPQMRWVGPYLTKGNTIILQLMAGVTVALFVIAVCLGISWVLRRAPLLRDLLGEKGRGESARAIPAKAP